MQNRIIRGDKLARPPINPMVQNGKGISYFEKLIEITSPFLKEDGIHLNFTGYKETVEEYISLQENDIDRAWKLTKELNAWSEYFSEIANLIQKMYLDAETDKLEVQSLTSMKYSEKNVSAGDRFANTTKEVIDSRKKRNALKTLHEELVSKIEFLKRGYYHCKSTCEWYNKKGTSIPLKDDEYDAFG